MFDQLLSPAYMLFTGALVLMAGIGVIEAVGLGIGHADVDGADAADAGGGDTGGAALLGWLGLNRGLPILVWLTGFLACFAFTGLAVQQIADYVTGAPLPMVIAAAAALAGGLWSNRYFSGVIAAVMPEYESTVIDSDDLLRRRATVLEGAARRGAPARARVVDYHGQAHYVMVEPHDDISTVMAGQTGMLVRRDGPLFYMITDDSALLSLG